MGAEGGGSGVFMKVVVAYFYVITWMSISISVIIFNKWILAYSEFPYPLALTMWHMVFCSTVGFLLVRVFKTIKPVGASGMPVADYFQRVFPIGALYALSLWLSNSAYLHLSVSFIQMTKALMPGLVYFVGVFYSVETLTRGTSANMFVIAVGVAVAAYGELHFVPIGVAEQLGALGFEATRLTLVQVLINKAGMRMNPFQSLYYISPACLVCLSLPFAFLELPRMLRETWIFNPLVLLLNALTAFALNLAVFLLIGKTSALTMNIAGVIKDWILIFWSAYLFSTPITTLNLVGYTVAFLAVCVYNYAKLQEMKAPPPPAPRADAPPLPVSGPDASRDPEAPREGGSKQN